MTKLEDSQAGSASRAQELRRYPRRKLAGMAYVELTHDNGGILLNLSEGGLAVQSALALSSREFPELRFQLPNMRGWLTGSGRVTWMSESKKEAGIEFLDLHEHARAQIRTWIAGRGETEVASGADAGHQEKRTPATGDYGGAGRKKNGAEAPVIPPPISPRQEDRSFRFHDYSMFAADTDADNMWVQPVKQRRGWGTYVLFTILLAALFFVLGAMVGRDNLNQLVASVEDWNRPEPPAAPKPPAEEEASPSIPPAENTPAATESSDTAKGPSAQTSQNGADGVSASQEQNKPAEQKSLQEQKPGGAEASQVAGGAQPPKSEPQGAKSGEIVAPPSRERTAAPAGAAKTPRRASYADVEGAGASDTGRSILVNAPAPGNSPLVVHLPGEAVSASTWVAISARRSIQVPARVDASAYGSQRIIVGKLVAHSDPYYPQEARNKRIEGNVELRAIIGRSGQILSVTPVSGPPVLLRAAETAVREWRYEPTFLNGDPVETSADVTMVFRSP